MGYIGWLVVAFVAGSILGPWVFGLIQKMVKKNS